MRGHAWSDTPVGYRPEAARAAGPRDGVVARRAVWRRAARGRPDVIAASEGETRPRAQMRPHTPKERFGWREINREAAQRLPEFVRQAMYPEQRSPG